MANVIGMRATSLAAAASVLAFAVMAALSVTYTVSRVGRADPRPVSVIEPPAPPAPPAKFTPPPRPQPLTPAQDEIASPPETPPAAATAAPAGFVPTGPVTVVDPHWTQRPHDLSGYFPRRTLERGIEGEAMLDCLVSVEGVLNCQVVSETPRNWGFGAAALRISRDYRMVPATRDGAPVEGRYQMRVPFRVTGSE